MAKHVTHQDLFFSLKKLLAENPDQKELIKQAVNAYLADDFLIRDHYCDLCDKRLSYEERNSVGVMDFMITCYGHREHANKFQIDSVRRQLNLPERRFFIKDFINSI